MAFNRRFILSLSLIGTLNFFVGSRAVFVVTKIAKFPRKMSPEDYEVQSKKWVNTALLQLNEAYIKSGRILEVNRVFYENKAVVEYSFGSVFDYFYWLSDAQKLNCFNIDEFKRHGFSLAESFSTKKV